jgi:uncharacterized protein (TIGR04255 family)
MAAPRTHLDRAPIVEAVIDMKVLPRDGVGPANLREAGGRIGPGYTGGEPLRSFQTRFGIENGREMSPATVSADVGWMFRFGSPERPTAIAQFRVNGFTFNKLEPYSNWEEVFGEADRLWQIYVEVARPLEVTRLAVRYINRMRFPNPTELRDYLEAPPLVPRPIPQTIQEFLTRRSISCKYCPCRCRAQRSPSRETGRSHSTGCSGPALR